jgi:ornithine cyclodeaminase
MIILSKDEVTHLLPMNEAIDLVEKAMIETSEGRATLPLRHAMPLSDVNKLGIMPGAMENPDCFGVKLISLYPDNPASGYSSHLGLMVLFEKEFGTPIAIMDAGVITAIRTAAASAVATQLLARENAQVLTVIGTGEQAEYHVESMLAVRDIREIRVVGRNQARAEAFVGRVKEMHDIPVTLHKSAQTAVQGADIVCTVTSAHETVLHGEWMQAGSHVNAVGASIPTMREIDENLLVKSSLFVDYRPSAFAQAGDIIAALESSAIMEDHIIGEIGEVLSHKVRGRENAEEITLYRSLGISAQDLICAHHVMTQAKADGIGVKASIS